MLRPILCLLTVAGWPIASQVTWGQADSVPAISNASETAKDNPGDDNPGDSAAAQSEKTATHTEIDPLIPRHQGQPVRLHTFKLDRQGGIVAGVSPMSAAGNQPAGYLQYYSATGELVNEVALPFAPTAIAIESNSRTIAAGDGKYAETNADGSGLTVADLPSASDSDPQEARKKFIEQYKQSIKDSQAAYREQLKMLQDQAEQLEQKKEDPKQELAQREAARLAAIRQQIESYEAILQQMDQPISEATIDAIMSQRQRIPSIASSEQYRFVTQSDNRGYAVWRFDRDWQNPKEVISGLTGCCGQMDIYAEGDRLYVAENTRFQVGVYDEEGKRLTGFGARAKDGNDWFGSCCNPMNVVCCANGEILTAESSIGKIKRFDASGHMIQYIGKARIGGGCKHVALGFDAKRNRYYIQYQDKNQICILVPNSEAKDFLVGRSELQQKAESIVRPLAGTWHRVPEKKTGSDKDAANNSPNNRDFVESITDFSSFDLLTEDHVIRLHRNADDTQSIGFPPMEDMRWVAVSWEEKENRAVLDIEDQDGLVMFQARIKPCDDGQIEVTFTYDAVEAAAKPKMYTRQVVQTSEAVSPGQDSK